MDKRRLVRIIIAFCFFIIVLLCDKVFHIEKLFAFNYNFIIIFALYFSVYLLIGYDILIKAISNVIHGEVLDENFLMFVASFAAFGLGIYKAVNFNEIEGFDEACGIIIFYQIGEFFQDTAVNKSRTSIAKLMDIRPDLANLVCEGEVKIVSPEDVKVGDLLLVNPGEKIPIDGLVRKGNSYIDTKALTGESKPLFVSENDEVISGSINLNSQIYITANKEFSESTVNKILELIMDASNNKSKSETFIKKFSKVYTPIVVILAVILATIPSLITKQFDIWLYRSLNFLVVSCPCALVISVPLAFFSCIGFASKQGILIKGSNFIETINKTNIFVFDKTGTLTKGNFVVSNVYPEENKELILKCASTAEKNQSHPIGKAIVEIYNEECFKDYVIENIPGKGVIARKNDDVIICGSYKLLESFNIIKNIDYEEKDETIVHVAMNEKYLGFITLKDEVKSESKEVIDYLNSEKIKSYLFSGDNEKVTKEVAKILNVTDYKSSLLPQNKVFEVEMLLNNKNNNEYLCFVGDGINDAPVLTRADVGISMGLVGSDAAIEASDIVFMDDDIRNIIKLKKLSKKTINIVYFNVVFALSIKALILILSVFGIANMWMSVFGDVGVAMIAILNSIRIFKK